MDCAIGRPPCMQPAADSGYLVDEADVTYWGLCPRCQGAGAVHPKADSVTR